MSIDKLSKEELELYSHKDITYMLIKEYFCNDISLKSNKEYSIGKCMFFWYRKAFC